MINIHWTDNQILKYRPELVAIISGHKKSMSAYRYTLKSIPKSFLPHKFAFQDNQLTVWGQTTPSVPQTDGFVDKTFVLVPTGGYAPKYGYLWETIFATDNLVFHCFEIFYPTE